jgi:hypothetical protein
MNAKKTKNSDYLLPTLLAAYLANAAGPVPLVLDLRIAHRVGSNTDPTLNGHLKYPNNLDQSLNDKAVDKIRKYHRVWYHLCLLFLVRQTGYIVNLSDFYSYRLIGKLTALLQIQESSHRNLPVVSSTSTVRFSHSSSREKLVWISLRLQSYVLILT